MTREEMARGCEEALQVALESVVDYSGMTALVKAATAELRKTCGECRYVEPCGRNECDLLICREHDSHVPLDGFCHRWEPRS